MRKLIFSIFSILLISTSAQAVPFKATQIAMTAQCPYAVRAGQLMAEQGGNAIDVALTMLLTMSVTNPSYAALGGGGFALVRTNNGKSVQVLDFREVGTAAMDKDYYVKRGEKSSMYGGTAVGVPGLPAGIHALHKKFGKVSWRKLFVEPIKLAENGYRVSGSWVESTKKIAPQFNSAGKKFLMKQDGKPYSAGEILKQPQLARALKTFRNRGADGFYQGVVAKDIVNTVQKTGGALNEKDLAKYTVKWREPLVEKYKDYKVYLMPPPSSGGIVIQQALRLTQLMELDKQEPRSSAEYHYLGEIFKRAYRGRSLLGDPDFHNNPLNLLLSDKYLKQLAGSFKKSKATEITPLDDSSLAQESKETSHLSVLTQNGDGVAMTFTLNGGYGSGVVTEQYGIALNNEMDDFTTQPGKPNMYGLIQGEGNNVAAGKRPLSSMSPTLVEKDGKIIGALGAPGGPRIISNTFQVLYRVIENKMDVDTAIQSPRVHHQFLPNILYVDKNRFSPDVLAALKAKNHVVEESWNANVNAVFNIDGTLEAAYDSRSEGAAGGF